MRKNAIVREVKHNILAYIQRNPWVNTPTLRQHFGSPKAIACAYVDTMALPDILTTMRVRQSILKLVATTMAFVALSWCVAITLALVQSEQSNGYQVISECEVVYEGTVAD